MKVGGVYDNANGKVNRTSTKQGIKILGYNQYVSGPFVLSDFPVLQTNEVCFFFAFF